MTAHDAAPAPWEAFAGPEPVRPRREPDRCNPGEPEDRNA